MRARSIKPSICDNEVLGTADLLYTVLFERLWMMADREGRLEDRPLRIKAQAFPYRDGLDVEAPLAWLDANEFIHRYTANGVRYIQVIKFLDHQKPHQNEKSSVIPTPPVREKAQASTTKVASEHNQGAKHLALTPSSLTPDSGLLTPDRLMDSSNPSGQPKRRPRAREEPSEFVEIRREFPKRSGGQRWGDALKFFRRRIAEGEKVEVILAGVRRYAQFTRAAGIERTEKVQQVATFLGDNRGYLELWQPPPRTQSPIERVREKLRSGNGDERVVSEQHGRPSEPSLGTASRMLRRVPDS
jgi:hypothetical protein